MGDGIVAGILNTFFSPQLYLSSDLLLWNSHIRNWTKKSLFCRKITKPLFLYCFNRHIHLKLPNWSMQSQAFLSLPPFFCYSKGRHSLLHLEWEEAGTASWNLAGFPSHPISRWGHGFRSFLRQKQNPAGAGVWWCSWRQQCQTPPRVLSPPLPDNAQKPLHSPAGSCKPCFRLFVLEWDISGDREKLPGRQVLPEGASSPWLWVYTQETWTETVLFPPP